MGQGSIIGGIYSKRIAMGNFVHFFIGGLSVAKGAYASQETALQIAGTTYSIFAILFAIVAFGNPLRQTQQEA